MTVTQRNSEISGATAVGDDADGGFWSNLAAPVVKRLVLGGAIFGAADPSLPTAQTANAATVVSREDDPVAVQLGKPWAGFYEGPERGGVLSLFVEYVSAEGPVIKFAGTAGAYNSIGAVASAHQLIDYKDETGFKVFVCAGSNYIKDLYEQGNRYYVRPEFFPGYTSRADGRYVEDIVALVYDTPVNQSAEMPIAGRRPREGEPLDWAGFGLPGLVGVGYWAATGDVRTGGLYVGSQRPLGGEREDLYFTSTLSLSPGELGGAPGDSGSWLRDMYGQYVAMFVKAGDGAGTYGLQLDLTTPEVGRFLERHLPGPTPNPAIPEPSTYGLALAGALLWCVSRIMYGSHGFKLLKSWCPNENVHVDVRL